jgi:tetratricopeptide (TPR) repeat protein
MRKTIVAAGLFVLFASVACGSVRGLKSPQTSDTGIAKPSKNVHIYQADYDTTFRSALDALRRVDTGSAKYVKHSEGVIIFKKPDEAGTVTARVERIDERSTLVELSAKNRRKYWLDGGDKDTRVAFFAELDKLLGVEMIDTGGGDTSESAPAVEVAPASMAPASVEPSDKAELLAGLRRELLLGDQEDLLDKLSYEELSSLDTALQSYGSVTAEKEKLARRCAACYIDLARLYHDSRRYNRSADALKIALSIAPDSAVAHCNLGEIYKHLGLYDEAVRELNEAKRLDSELPDTYINLGIIYDDYVVDDQKALENYRKYLELGGADKQVSGWIERLEEGS